MRSLQSIHMALRRPTTAITICLLWTPTVTAQTPDNGQQSTMQRLLDGIDYFQEIQASLSSGNTPLWLNANKYGLSSLKEGNGYTRAGITRALTHDDNRQWGVGYGVDMAVTAGYTSTLVLQQLYFEGRWKKGTLTIGEKERPMELKNNSLSSGSQTLGINARPIPQIRVDLSDWDIPGLRGKLKFRGHLAYGYTTDDGWQKSFTKQQSRYTQNTLFHSKAGYLTISNIKALPGWSLQGGLEMATQFGGTTYRPTTDGTMEEIHNGSSLKDLWHALVPGGSEITETTYKNAAGNHVGSIVARLQYENNRHSFALYADKYFEDHSSMYLLDYNGYGDGDEWNVKKHNRVNLYSLKDIMLGLEYRRKQPAWLDNAVVEYLYTMYQSGPVYHDHTSSYPDQVGGRDQYYNHFLFTGWQHWGQAIGNPLYRSPIYNTDGTIYFHDTRFVAWHLGIAGTPSARLRYRLLATWQKGLGTYDDPYYDYQYNTSIMAEAVYSLPYNRHKWMRGIDIKAAVGADFGKLLGYNKGFQLTVTRRGKLRNIPRHRKSNAMTR